MKLDQPVKIGSAQALLVALGDDEVSQKLLKEFEKVPFKVVIASQASALTAVADVVLPAANWLEQEGHYLSLDGRLQTAKRCLTPAAEVRPSADILAALAEATGVALPKDWAPLLHERVAVTEIVK